MTFHHLAKFVYASVLARIVTSTTRMPLVTCYQKLTRLRKWCACRMATIPNGSTIPYAAANTDNI